MRIRENIHKYGDDISLAKLDGLAKGLLWLYANEFQWMDVTPSKLTEREICAKSGMAQSTYFEKRKYLEHLGWIKVENNGYHKPCSVYPTVGIDDPAYELRSWAEWHPYNDPYMRLVRQEQLRMLNDGIDLSFSQVNQLIEYDDGLYESLLEDSLPSDPESSESRKISIALMEKSSENFEKLHPLYQEQLESWEAGNQNSPFIYVYPWTE